MRRFLFCIALILPTVARADSPEPLPEKDPLTFLEKCLAKYEQSGIKGYTAVMHKQERINGELRPSEEIDIVVREEPYSVLMRWLKGQGRASSVLFVEGENDGMMLAKPTGLAGRLISYVRRDPEGDEAKQAGRYSVKTVGVKKACAKTLRAWRAAKEEGTLKVEYLGVRKVKEAGDRLCYTLRRYYAKPEEDGVLEGTFYVDKETWFQVGTVLKGEKGKLIGEYFFRDIRVNPDFKANQFQSSALSQ